MVCSRPALFAGVADGSRTRMNYGALLIKSAQKVVEKYRHRIVKWLEVP